MSGNPLVADRVDTTTPLAGTFLLEDGEALVDSIESKSWVSGGLAIVSGVADAAAAVSDPLGTLIAMGLGWVLDHVPPLNEWLEELTGDADQVRAHAQTWVNVKAQMDGAAAEMSRDVAADFFDASGQTVDAYVGASGDVVKAIEASGRWAGGMGTALEVMATIVQVVHDFVRDALSELAGSILSYAAELLASVGTALPLVLEQISTRAASLISRAGKKIEDLIASASALSKKLGDLKSLFSDLGSKLDDLFHGARNADVVPKAPDVDAPKTPKPGDPSVNYGTYVGDDGVVHIGPDDPRPYLDPTSRPSFRKGVVEAVWKKFVRSDGTVVDPDGRVIKWEPGTSRRGVWDMGHKPKQKYHDVWLQYVKGEMTPAEFRDWYNDPSNYRVEHPATNRGHKHE